MKKRISLCFLFASLPVYSGNELATLHSDWYQNAQKNYTGNIESLFTVPLPHTAIHTIKLKYSNDPSHKVSIVNLTKHLQTPDGKKKEMQEDLAMKIFLKDYLNKVPADLMLFLLFGIEGYRNENLAQYLQRNIKLLQFIKTVDAIKRIEQEFSSNRSQQEYTSQQE